MHLFVKPREGERRKGAGDMAEAVEEAVVHLLKRVAFATRKLEMGLLPSSDDMVLSFVLENACVIYLSSIDGGAD